MTPNLVDINYATPVINAYLLPNINANIIEPVSDNIDSVPNTIEIHKLTLKEVPIFKLSRYIFS